MVILLPITSATVKEERRSERFLSALCVEWCLNEKLLLIVISVCTNVWSSTTDSLHVCEENHTGCPSLVAVKHWMKRIHHHEMEFSHFL